MSHSHRKELIGGDDVNGAEVEADLVSERMMGYGVVLPLSLVHI